MQILTPAQAAFLGSLLVIYVGITVEKYYVSWSSVYANTLNLLLLVSCINLPLEVLLLMAMYTIIGYVAVKLRWKKIFPLFGCKTYGSLMLVLILGSQGYFFGIYSPLSVGIAWFLVALVVHSVGYLHARGKI